jgi:putative MATE family efflux protein
MQATTRTNESQGIRASIREAILGTERDFTEGSIGRAIALLSIPMVLEMAMESLFGVVDIFWVAHLGADAMATVGLTESFLTIVFALAMGLSMATTAIVARRTGEKNPEAASLAATQAILVGVVISIVLGIAGYLLAPDLLRAMGATESIIKTGAGFTRTILGGCITVTLLFLINAVFRGAGDAAIAMRVLWIANAVNIILNPLLIFGIGPFPQLGIAGSAVGTTIGRGVGVAYQLWVLTRHSHRIQVKPRHWRFDLDVMTRLVKLSIGGILQYLIGVASWIALIRINAFFGPAAIAGYTLAIRVIVFAILPSWGMSNAGATLVGQNLGASKPDRAEKSVYLAGFYNMMFLGFVAVIFIAFAPAIIGIFTHDAEVVPFAVACLRIVSAGYIAYAWGMVLTQAFNGAGDTTTPTVLNFFFHWILQIPLAWALAFPLGWGPKGVFIAIAAAESLLTVAALFVFRQGRWKLKKV